MTESGPIWKAEVEAAIRRVPGVTGAYIQMQGDEIDSISVLTDGRRESKRFVRDVEAIVGAIARIDLDRRKVSIAEVTPIPGGDPSPAHSTQRLAFESVRLKTSGVEAEVSVELSIGGARVAGTLSGPATRGGALELVAGACLQAMEQIIEDPVSFSSGGLERLRVGRDRVIVVLVRFIEGRTEKALVGVSLTDRDELEAAAQATLDAVNRILPSLRIREPVEYILHSEAPEASVILS